MGVSSICRRVCLVSEGGCVQVGCQENREKHENI